MADRAEILISAIDQATDVLDKIERKMGSVSDAGDKLKYAMGAIAGALSVGMIASFAERLVSAAADLDHLSERTGIAVGALSELKFAAQRGNVDMEQFGKSIGFFEKTMVAATDASSKQGQMFTALGVDITKGPNEALMQFAKRTASIEDAAVKTAVFREAFGKVGDQLIPVFKNLKETTDQAKALGITMSDETAKAAHELELNLKALEAQSAALYTEWIAKDVGALAAITTNIEKAAESGNKWLGVLKEIARVGIAADASIFQNIPVLGRLFDSAASSLFKDPNGMRPGEVGGKIGGMTSVGVDRPNSNELAKILAGMKDASGGATQLSDYDQEWNKLVATMQEADKQAAGLTASILHMIQDGDLGKITEEQRKQILNLAAEIETRQHEIELAKEQKDAEAKIGEEINKRADAAAALLFQEKQHWLDLVDPSAKYFDQLDQIETLREKGYLTEQQADKAHQITMDNIHKAIDGTATATKQADDFGKQMGLTFSSAFEDAVVKGKGLRDVLKGIEQDIVRIVTRQLVTKPIGDAISGAVSGSGAASWLQGIFGGGGAGWNSGYDLPMGKATGGDVSAGQAYLVGEKGPELFMPGSSGSIVPNHALGRAGGGHTIVMNITTPNASSFVANRGDIIAQMSRALSAAQRNL